MDKAALKTLEYNKILSKLAEKAGSKLGRELCLGLHPASDIDDVRESLAQTAEAVYVDSMTRPPLGGIFDLRPSIKKVGLGAVLELQEIPRFDNHVMKIILLKQKRI